MDNLKEIIKDKERRRQEEIYEVIQHLFGLCMVGALLWFMSNCF